VRERFCSCCVYSSCAHGIIYCGLWTQKCANITAPPKPHSFAVRIERIFARTLGTGDETTKLKLKAENLLNTIRITSWFSIEWIAVHSIIVRCKNCFAIETRPNPKIVSAAFLFSLRRNNYFNAGQVNFKPSVLKKLLSSLSFRIYSVHFCYQLLDKVSCEGEPLLMRENQSPKQNQTTETAYTNNKTEASNINTNGSSSDAVKSCVAGLNSIQQGQILHEKIFIQNIIVQ